MRSDIRDFGDPFSPAKSHAQAWQPLESWAERPKLGRPGKAYMHSPRREAPFTWNPAPDEADRVFGDVRGWSAASNHRLGGSGFMPPGVATTTAATPADDGKGAPVLLPAPPTQDLIALYALCGGSEPNGHASAHTCDEHKERSDF